MNGIFTLFIVALSVAGLASAPSASQLLQARSGALRLAEAEAPFDGKWQVESVRLEGNCIERNSYTLTIRDGVMEAVLEGRAGSYRLKGKVSEDGAFESRIEGKFDRVTVRGLLSGDKGEARWASESKCTGKMIFERIK